MSDGLVRMSFQIDALGKKLSAMICEEADSLDGAVREAFDHLKTSGNLELIVQAEVEKGVRSAVEHAMGSWHVKDALAKRVAALLSNP